MAKALKAPFPYFGGKSRVAAEVWKRFGTVSGYLEPFGGSLAVTLGNPYPRALKSETVNDLDGFICNFWRAVKADPDGVAAVADWPVNQLDLSARHGWLRAHRSELADALAHDPDYFDTKMAGWWVWGISQWIGSGWCAYTINQAHTRPQLSNHGMGVHSPKLRQAMGGRGVFAVIHALSKRLRRTRVTCCDWSALCSTVHHACPVWAVFLDPPYTSASGRQGCLYAQDSMTLGHKVAEWAFGIGARKDRRVALCGISGEYDIPDGWTALQWSTKGFSQAGRDRREQIWFSPHCVGQGHLF